MNKRLKFWGTFSLVVASMAALPVAIVGITKACEASKKNNYNNDENQKEPDTNIPSGDVNQPVVQPGVYPQFLNNIQTANLTNLNVKSILSLNNALINDSNIFLSSKSLTQQQLQNLLRSVLTPKARTNNNYLLADVYTYLLDLYNTNNKWFSLHGNEPQVIQRTPDNVLDVQITGSFELENVTNQPQQLKDANGQPFPNLLPIPAKGKIKFEFSNLINDTVEPLQAKIFKLTSNQLFLNWVVPSIKFIIGDRDNYEPPDVGINEHLYNGFVFNNAYSNLNVKLDFVVDGIDPYTAAFALSGPDQIFNTNLINPQRLKQDVDNLFNSNFTLAKQSTTYLHNIFSSISTRPAFKIGDLIYEQAENTADLIMAFFPELQRFNIDDQVTFKAFIVDILSSYKTQNAQAKNLYDIIFKYRNLIFSILKSQLSFFADFQEVIDSFFKDVNTPEKLFELLQQFSGQIDEILQTQNSPALLNLVHSLIASKDIYLIDFLTDKTNVNNIVDLIWGFCQSSQQVQQNPMIADFINKYKTLFVDLLTSANLSVDDFVNALLANNKQLLHDIFALLSVNVQALSPTLKNVFDLFITDNALFNDPAVATPKIKTLLAEIASLLRPENINKVSIAPSNPDCHTNIAITYDENNIPTINDLNLTYNINANGLSIPNSFIYSILDLLPTEHLGTTIARFATDEVMKQASDQAKIETQEYISKQIYGPFVPESVINNIIYGPTGDNKSGLLNTMLNDTIKSMPANASLNTLMKEVVFGTSTPTLTNEWIQINGTTSVSYSGTNLSVMPLFSRSVNGDLNLNYQIINPTLAIDATSMATNSLILKNVETTTSPIIPHFNLSSQLHTAFVNMVKKFVSSSVKRRYETHENLYLYPSRSTNYLEFKLDPSKPQQNVLPSVYIDGLSANTTDLLSNANMQSTIQNLLVTSWSCVNNVPSLTPEAQNTIATELITLSPALTSKYNKYITHSLNLYGSGDNTVNITATQKVFIMKFWGKDIWVNIPFNINLNFEFRFMDYAIILPYPILVTDQTNHNSLTSRLNVSLNKTIASKTFSV